MIKQSSPALGLLAQKVKGSLRWLQWSTKSDAVTVSLGESELSISRRKGRETKQDSSNLSPRFTQNSPGLRSASQRHLCRPGFPRVSPALSLPGAWHVAGSRKFLPQEHSISHLSLSQEHQESGTCFQTVLTELWGSSRPCPHRSSAQRSSVNSAHGCSHCWSRDQLRRTQGPAFVS